jgi:outer membrane protein assembly factor BamA
MVAFVLTLVLAGSAAPSLDQPPNKAEALERSKVSSGAQAVERIVEIRVQGNFRTPEDEVRRIAAVQVGDVIGPDTLTAIDTRLEDSGKFDEVDIRKRWRTIDATDEIVLVIVVREVPGGSSRLIGRIARSLTRPLILPVLTYTDGYGLTYGARLSPVNLVGRDIHVSIPLTWGATRQAALELDRPFASGPLTRVSSSLAIRERRNPFYDVDDRRVMVTVGGERAFRQAFRARVVGTLSDVSFAAAEPERLVTWGADFAFDTRTNMDLPRNAAFLQIGWERLQLDEGPVDRYRADARGFVGLVGSSVLAVRALGADATGTLPPYEQFLFGGASSVRGFRTGYGAGESLVLGSAELRAPFTSPLSFGRAGASLFVDTGTVYEEGERLRDARFRTGVGGGLFFNAAVFSLNLDVARGLDRGWRVHVSSGLQF